MDLESIDSGGKRMSEIIKKYKDTSKNSFSRYKNLSRVIDDGGYSYIETPDRIVIGEDKTDGFFKVEKGYENRIDLISYKFYSTTMLWWVIAEINDIRNPLLIEAGTILRIPTISRLSGIGGVLS